MIAGLSTGISSGHLEWKSLDELFERAHHELDLNLIEIWSEQIGYPPDRDVSAELKRLSKAHNILLGYHGPLHGDYDLAHRNAARPALDLPEVLRVASRCGVSYLVMHLGSNPDRQLGLRSAMSALAQNRVLIEKARVKLVLEVVPSVWGDQVGDLVSDFETIFNAFDKPWLGVCLDYGHALLNGNLFDFINRLGSRILYAHINDNMGTADDHLAFGMGKLDWSRALRETFKTPFRGPFVIEYPEFHGRDKTARFLTDLEAFYLESKK